ncbi:sugar ABC transporter ATP-binding protein [Mesorhizobium shangrilense]|uniref:sugar ABC transporter ATP-binding protein n=1 Tax=Mesorhizobium shangrilense TaxID=460060 RepID=UPI003F492251
MSMTPIDTNARRTRELSQAPFLQLSGISKRYGGVTALNTVNFACQRGAVHAVLGENGAGKSTLIKIISGVVRPDDGAILLDGQAVSFATPADAMKNGIVGIFQELSLIPDLSVEANICLTSPPGRLGFVNFAAQRRFAKNLLDRVGCGDIHPGELVRNLSLSRKQMVEIAKALGRRARLVILDEATSALTGEDVKKVYSLIERLRNEGVAILYISHRMHEIAHLADECSVFRNGQNVATFANGEHTDGEIVRMMIGRDFKHVFPEKPARTKAPRPALEIEHLSWADRIKDVSLSVDAGEIVGLGGLDGQGQRELFLALFGVLRGVTGTVRVNGASVTISSPRKAKSKAVGIALVPEDRKTEGLILPMTVRDNMSLASIGRYVRRLMIDRASENAEIGRQVERMAIKAANPDVVVGTLSGGNQQKVLIGKWLMTGARILLLNDPTRGIDVGTKQEIYALMRKLADEGTAILFYSTDYDELIGCCDRVAIFYDGAVRRELDGDDIVEHNIVAASLALDAAAHSDEGRAAQ